MKEEDLTKWAKPRRLDVFESDRKKKPSPIVY